MKFKAKPHTLILFTFRLLIVLAISVIPLSSPASASTPAAQPADPTLPPAVAAGLVAAGRLDKQLFNVTFGAGPVLLRSALASSEAGQISALQLYSNETVLEYQSQTSLLFERDRFSGNIAIVYLADLVTKSKEG